MISLKKEVFEALSGNQKLIQFLGGKRIYAGRVPDLKELPVLTFFEVTNADAVFADDKSVASEIILQVDIWSKEGNTAVAQEVDHIMKDLSFQRTSAMDLFEDKEGIFHKAMRYTTIKFDNKRNEDE